jgi:hypothetical protein
MRSIELLYDSTDPDRACVLWDPRNGIIAAELDREGSLEVATRWLRENPGHRLREIDTSKLTQPGYGDKDKVWRE